MCLGGNQPKFTSGTTLVLILIKFQFLALSQRPMNNHCQAWSSLMPKWKDSVASRDDLRVQHSSCVDSFNHIIGSLEGVQFDWEIQDFIKNCRASWFCSFLWFPPWFWMETGMLALVRRDPRQTRFNRAPLEPVTPTIPRLEIVVYKENSSLMILCIPPHPYTLTHSSVCFAILFFLVFI